MAAFDDRASLSRLVEDAIERWREGETPDAASFLARHPEVGARKTLALDLIHEELCLRREAGDTVLASTFIERFPDFRSSIVKMLAVERYGESHPLLAQDISEALWPRVGQEYQGFEIVEPLGRGALARVYLARETAMGRRAVVVKVSRDGGHEAQLLGKLEHPNIVTAFSVKQDPTTGMTVICMPLLGTSTGLDLLDAAFQGQHPPDWATVIGETARRYRPAEMVKKESLAEAWPFARRTYAEGICWLGSELAAGLGAASKLGIAHRDIKPSNMLLAWSGRPMLLDFNLSADEEESGKRIGGTIAYMAPERIKQLLEGRSEGGDRLDPRPDIFSLGVVLYELLAGCLPVQPADADKNDQRSLERWLESRSQPIATLSRFNPHVDPDLEAVVMRCLAVDPAQRFATAEELRQALAAYLTKPRIAARWVRRNRRLVLAAGVSLAASMIGSAAYLSARPGWLYEEGLRRYAAGDYAGAVEVLSKSLRSEPKNVARLFARGQAQYRIGQFEAAREDFLSAAKVEDRALFWFCAGCCSLSDRDAPEWIGRAEILGYDPAAVKCNLGICWEHAGKRKAAIENLRGAIHLNQQLQPALLELAALHLNDVTSGHRGNFDEALSAASMAIELGPETPRLLYVAAALHAQARQDRKHHRGLAAEYLKRYIEIGGPTEKLRRDVILRTLLQELEAQGALRNIVSGTVVTDAPRGVPPPATADLSLLTSP